jgi:transposase
MVPNCPLQPDLEVDWLQSEMISLGTAPSSGRLDLAAALRYGLSNARVESGNQKIRLIIRRSFGFHYPAALIALAKLSLGGLCPALPGRA